MFTTEEQKRLFFIIGAGRSGTSLLQELFNCFRGFHNKGESRVEMPNKTRRSCHDFIRESGNFAPLEKFIKSKWERRYFVEKTPNSVLSLDKLATRYPFANFIFIERNPLNIMLSQLSKHLDENLPEVKKGQEASGLSFEVYHTKRIVDMIEAQVKFKPLCKKQITIRYEDLVKDYKPVIERITTTSKLDPNMERVAAVMSKPSYSSKNVTHKITQLTDPEAIALVNKACKLWGYPEVFLS